MEKRNFKLSLLIVIHTLFLDKYLCVSAEQSCDIAVDVAFILDSSGSLRNEYQKEKNFLKTLAAVFGISENGSRAGVITFSYNAVHSIKLNQFSDLESFNNAVDNIPLMGFTTRIDKALRLAQKEMFTNKNGGRDQTTKLIILLTDGSQTIDRDSEDPDIIADELRKEGITIIGVGIGSGINETELSHISGGKANTYSAATFDTLTDNSFLQKIKKSSCEIAKPKPSCQTVADVGFILDSSGSLRNQYKKEKDFLKSLIAVFGISTDGTRAGVITFSYHADHSIKLNNFTDLISFNKAVDDIPLMGSTTRIDKALRLAQKELFLEKNGGRPGVPKLLFLLTDGSQTLDPGSEDPDVIADEMRLMGVNIIGIGIGKGINVTELAHIAGGKNNTYSANFDELEESNFLHDIRTSSCKTVSVQQSCDIAVDVAFILDSSGSLRNEYQKEKNFLKTLAAVFGISENGSRAGVITFSYNAVHSIKLNQFSDLESFNNAVDNIPLMGFTTRIDKALRLAQKEVFTNKNGGRDQTTKLIILLTDGSQTIDRDSEDPDIIADELRKEGVIIIGVGIGSGVNETELSHISGGRANTYSAATFDTLIDNSFLQKIKKSSCEIAKEKPVCKIVVDIGFILDSSGSLKNEYQKEKDFLKSLIAIFGISADGTRAGVITFSYHAEHSIRLNNFTEISRFNEAVDNIPLMGSTTRIDKALRLAQKELFIEKYGGRQGVPKLLFLLTDGSQTQGRGVEDPDVIADELRSMGVKIIGIGIGKGINITELTHIAGSEKNTFSANFDELKERHFLDDIRNSLCNTAYTDSSSIGFNGDNNRVTGIEKKVKLLDQNDINRKV